MIPLLKAAIVSISVTFVAVIFLLSHVSPKSTIRQATLRPTVHVVGLALRQAQLSHPFSRTVDPRAGPAGGTMAPDGANARLDFPREEALVPPLPAASSPPGLCLPPQAESPLFDRGTECFWSASSLHSPRSRWLIS